MLGIIDFGHHVVMDVVEHNMSNLVQVMDEIDVDEDEVNLENIVEDNVAMDVIGLPVLYDGIRRNYITFIRHLQVLDSVIVIAVGIEVDSGIEKGIVIDIMDVVVVYFQKGHLGNDFHLWIRQKVIEINITQEILISVVDANLQKEKN